MSVSSSGDLLVRPPKIYLPSVPHTLKDMSYLMVSPEPRSMQLNRPDPAPAIGGARWAQQPSASSRCSRCAYPHQCSKQRRRAPRTAVGALMSRRLLRKWQEAGVRRT